MHDCFHHDDTAPPPVRKKNSHGQPTLTPNIRPDNLHDAIHFIFDCFVTGGGEVSYFTCVLPLALSHFCFCCCPIDDFLYNLFPSLSLSGH